MPRRSGSSLIPLDPEIERTLRRIRKDKTRRVSRIEGEVILSSENCFALNLNMDNENLDNNPNPNPNPQNRINNRGNVHNRVGENQPIEVNNRGNVNVHNRVGENQPRRRTIREVTQSGADFNQEQYAGPDFTVDFEIKGPLYHSLPKFHGLAGENPYTHLNALLMHCRTMKPLAASLEEVMWKVFHITLEGKAQEWYMSLPRYMDNPYQSWPKLRRAFLEKYYPSTKTSAARKEISSVKQDPFETFYEFWNRFQDMVTQCPNHQIQDEHLVQYFYEGLLPQDADKLDAAANGSVEDMEAQEAWNLIRRLALNRQHSSNGDRRALKGVDSGERDPLLVKLAHDMEKLTAKVDRLATQPSAQTSPQSLAMVAASCTQCDSCMHMTADCPHRCEEVSAMYQQRSGQFQRGDPYSNTYNPGWRDHPNLRWGGNTNQGETSKKSTMIVPINQEKGLSAPSSSSNELQLVLKSISDMSTKLEARMDREKSDTDSKITAICKQFESCFTNVFAKFEQMETKHDNLNAFVTQLSNSMSEQQAKSSGSMPSNTVINPKSLNAISLRSGKKLEEPQPTRKEEEMCEKVDEPPAILSEENSTKEPEQAQQPSKATEADDATNGVVKRKGKEVCIEDLPFPNSYLYSKKLADEKQDKEILELFSKLEVNVPLLELIKKVPKYAKFLKDLCTNKRKFKPNKKVQVSSNVSALFKPQLPIKCQDPGSFTIPCTIGKATINGALLDLGAAINVMPKSVYESLGIKALKPTSVVLQLADRTIRHPHGILENILVKVKDLVFPADFYVLDMCGGVSNDSTLILGRPFLRTANTLISMKDGLITMEVGDQKINFNMYETMRYPNEDYSLLGLNAINMVGCEFSVSRDNMHKLVLPENDRISTCAESEKVECDFVCLDCGVDRSCSACLEINAWLPTPQGDSLQLSDNSVVDDLEFVAAKDFDSSICSPTSSPSNFICESDLISLNCPSVNCTDQSLSPVAIPLIAAPQSKIFENIDLLDHCLAERLSSDDTGRRCTEEALIRKDPRQDKGHNFILPGVSGEQTRVKPEKPHSTLPNTFISLHTLSAICDLSSDSVTGMQGTTKKEEEIELVELPKHILAKSEARSFLQIRNPLRSRRRKSVPCAETTRGGESQIGNTCKKIESHPKVKFRGLVASGIRDKSIAGAQASRNLGPQAEKLAKPCHYNFEPP